MPYRGKQNYQQYQQDYPQGDQYQQNYQQPGGQYQQDYQQADQYQQNYQQGGQPQQNYQQGGRPQQNYQQGGQPQQNYQQGQGGQSRRFKGNNGGRPRAASQPRTPEFYDQHPNYARPVFREDGSPEWRKFDAEVIDVKRSNPFQSNNPKSNLTEACFIRVQPLSWKFPVFVNGFIDFKPEKGEKLHIFGKLAERNWVDNEGVSHRSVSLQDARCMHLNPQQWQQAINTVEARKAKIASMQQDQYQQNYQQQGSQYQQNYQQQGVQYQQNYQQPQVNVQPQANVPPMTNVQAQTNVPPMTNVQPQTNVPPQANVQPLPNVQAQANIQPQANVPSFDESVPEMEEDTSLGNCPF